MPSFVTFLRTFGWDGFVRRQAKLLQQRAAHGDFYVLADESPRPFGTGMQAWETSGFIKLGHSARSFTEMGLPVDAPNRSNPLWWNCDYGFYDALRQMSRPYDYYVFVEDDVGFNVDVAPIIGSLSTQGVDVLSLRGARELAGWTPLFRQSAEGLPYGDKSWTPLSVLMLSDKALRYLSAERLRLAALRRKTGAGVEHWPFCECFVSSAIVAAGLGWTRLGDYADVRNFSSEYAFMESDPLAAVEGSIVHAVLDKRRFADKFFSRTYWALLRMGDYAALEHARQSLISVGTLAASGCRVRQDIAGNPNLARGRPSLQSSVSRWSVSDDPARAARGANSGVLTGGFGIHTDNEDQPWWSVDLGTDVDVSRVLVFGPDDCAYRLRHFSLWGRRGGEWRRVYQKSDETEFGGVEHPCVVELNGGARMDEMRVVLDATNCLHLDEVEAYHA